MHRARTQRQLSARLRALSLRSGYPGGARLHTDEPRGACVPFLCCLLSLTSPLADPSLKAVEVIDSLRALGSSGAVSTEAMQQVATLLEQLDPADQDLGNALEVAVEVLIRTQDNPSAPLAKHWAAPLGLKQGLVSPFLDAVTRVLFRCTTPPALAPAPQPLQNAQELVKRVVGQMKGGPKTSGEGGTALILAAIADVRLACYGGCAAVDCPQSSWPKRQKLSCSCRSERPRTAQRHLTRSSAQTLAPKKPILSFTN